MNIIEKVHEKINYKYQDSFDAPITFDNKLIRSGKKDHIWLYAKEWEYKGRSYQEIDFGSWKFGDKENVKSWSADDITSDKNFQKAYKKKTLEASAKVEMDKQRRQKECKEKWSKILKSCVPATDHEYLNFKGVSSFGLKTDKNGVLLIPCKDSNGLTGAQRIYKDPETGEFTKRFSSGIKIQGSIHALSPLKNKSLCYLSEGYATAASIQIAFPDTPSVCCFNASNINHAIETIRTIYPDIKICIAADDDRSLKDNVGVRYARQASNRFKNTIYRIPQFNVKNPSWTDFNDLHQFGSLNDLIEQLFISEDEFSFISPLGYNESNYYYVSSENKQIVCLSVNSHNKIGLKRLIANDSYWLKQYGTVNPEDDSIKMNWDAATSDLMGKCHKVGLFNASKVRGTGVWRDDQKIVINDGEKVHNANEKSNYNYQKTIKQNYDLTNENPESLLHLLEAFKNIRYKNEKDFFYISAFVIQSYIFPVLDWRFHIWVNGSAGTGKSTVVKWIDSLMVNSELLNNTSAAGIRQNIQSNATTIIYDEAEPSNLNVKGVIDLAREMSSNGGFQTWRGTASGNAINYNTQCVLLFSSIQIYNLNQADRSRIFTIELDTLDGQKQEEYDDISARMKHFAKYKSDIFTATYNSIENIIDNIDYINRFLKSNYKIESRLADQLSVAMGCHYVYFSTGKISETEVKNMVEIYGLINSEYTEQNSVKEHESCYDSLMSVIVDNYNSLTVAECIHNLKATNSPQDHTFYEKLLGVYGLKYSPKANELFIQNKNGHLQKKLEEYPDYSRVLSRDSSIIKGTKIRTSIIQLGYVRGIKIKVK